MVSTLGTRPSHYEVLGLKADASRDEIEQAFAREMGRPRAFGGLALVGVAYETLRDPARRRAYDASLGLKPPPESDRSRRAMQIAPQFIGAAPGYPTERRPLPEPAGESALPPFIASALRDLASPDAHVRPDPGPRPEPVRGPKAEAGPGPQAAADLAFLRAGGEPLGDVEDDGIDWKKSAIAIGALVASAGLFGIWAGWEAGNDIEAKVPERAVRVALPRAKPGSAERSRTAVSEPAAINDQPARASHAAAAIRPAKRAPVPQQRALTAEEIAELPPIDVRARTSFVESATQQVAAVAPLAAEAPPAQAAMARMPLPERVIARTIGSIGYACGQVASTAAVEGEAPGVFKVTCTSGHSYQARPVRGRYRFKRWDRR